MIEDNVNNPVNGSIGADRIDGFKKVVEHAWTLPNGRHRAVDLPNDLQIKNLLAIHVQKGRYCALEFPSHPLDSDPVFVFVHESVDKPDLAAQDICTEHHWHFSQKLFDPRWYFAYGQ